MALCSTHQHGGLGGLILWFSVFYVDLPEKAQRALPIPRFEIRVFLFFFTFCIHLLPWLLDPGTNVANASAGNLELSIHLHVQTTVVYVSVFCTNLATHFEGGFSKSKKYSTVFLL